MENGSTEQERLHALLHQQQQLKRTIDVTTDIIK